jgi:hypothetical protein
MKALIVCLLIVLAAVASGLLVVTPNGVYIQTTTHIKIN